MMKILNNRKSQFYILTAIMLIAYSLLLLQSLSVVPYSSKNFRHAFDNFAFESHAALNNALFEREDVNEEFEVFLESFISYSRMKKLNIETVTVLETGNRVYVSNHMNNPVHIINLNQTVDSGSYEYFLRSAVSEMVLEVRDDVFHENIYKFTILSQGTDAKAVMRLRKGSEQEIFVME
ncbi:hypothetical protein HQ545_04515 [Candidatus Woesearchaeota archaeon]|nr:hypothetical protein [Candidatus Woesearchaeota archaeon]